MEKKRLTVLARNVTAAMAGGSDLQILKQALTDCCKVGGLGLYWDKLPHGPGMIYRVALMRKLEDSESFRREDVLFVDEDGYVYIESQLPEDPLLAARAARLQLALALQTAQEYAGLKRQAAENDTMSIGKWLTLLVSAACNPVALSQNGETEVDVFLRRNAKVVLTT
jgi:hypothetical protein